LAFIEHGDIDPIFFPDVRDEVLHICIQQAVSVYARDLCFHLPALIFLDRERVTLE